MENFGPKENRGRKESIREVKTSKMLFRAKE